jgi:hypothetical protein
MRRNKLIHMRLSVHGALTACYVANGMSPEEASKSAFNVVQGMSEAKLVRYYETGR